MQNWLVYMKQYSIPFQITNTHLDRPDISLIYFLKFYYYYYFVTRDRIHSLALARQALVPLS